MRPLFTVHAGEFVVGEFIERTYPTLNVWIPAKDTGIDLLVTGKSNRQPVSLQVKLSRDYKRLEATDDLDRSIAAAGWLTIYHDKIEKSPADWWVFVLVSHERNMKPQFIVIKPAELLQRLERIHRKSQRYHFYPWVTKNPDLCLDGRGIERADRQSIVERTFDLGPRDLTSFLNNWSALHELAAAE